MTNAPFFTDVAAAAAIAGLATLANSGVLKIYSGTKPAGANTALSGNTVLAQLTLNATAFAAASSSGSDPTRTATAAANSITGDTSADATGTASFFRVFKSDGTTALFDGTVGTSGCDLNLATVSIVAAQDVEITSFSLTMPE